MLLHNGSLADPLNKISQEIKKISSKRNKTDADQVEMGRLEWFGSWYQDRDGNFIIPGNNIKASLVNGAKLFKLGAAVKRSLFVTTHAILEFEGKDTLDNMWANDVMQFAAMVKVGTSKVRRVRPHLERWSAIFSLAYDEEVFERDEITRILDTAGKIAGLGDWTPRFGGNYGQFEVVT